MPEDMNSVTPLNDVSSAEPIKEGTPIENDLAENDEIDQMNVVARDAREEFKPQVPFLIRQLQGQIVELGIDSVTFSCEFRNATGVGWSFNGKALGPDEKYDIRMNGNEVILTVKDVGLDDSGVYICYAVNTDGRVTTVGYLSVRGKFFLELVTYKSFNYTPNSDTFQILKILFLVLNSSPFRNPS